MWENGRSFELPLIMSAISTITIIALVYVWAGNEKNEKKNEKMKIKKDELQRYATDSRLKIRL